MKTSFTFTKIACYASTVVQASIINLSPLLFVQFASKYNITEARLAFIIILNFSIQMLVDALASKIIVAKGYSFSCKFAHIFSAIGLILLGLLPMFIDPYIGILLGTMISAVGAGVLEVIISPIIDALPAKNKTAELSLLHSFYCWGHIAVILLSTLYFATIGIENWYYLPILFALLPIITIFIFNHAKFITLEGDKSANISKNIFKMKYFMIFFLLMVCAGASEQSIAQWSSYFAEISLGLNSKALGDILGTCLFAFGMAVVRTLYGFYADKMAINKFIILSSACLVLSYLFVALSPIPLFSLLAIGCSGLFVGIMWPGLMSLASKHYPLGGTRMFGFLALAGDFGCMSGPFLIASISSNLKVGMMASSIFPLLIFIFGIFIYKKLKNNA